jgi:cytosine permease
MSETHYEKDREYALSPVPITARLPLIATVMLWAGLTLDPSAPYLASWWGSIYQFATLILGTVIATIVLSIFSSLSAYIASKEGLTYALAAEKVYGSQGVAIPSLWAGIVCIGWLAFSIGVVAEGIIYLLKLPSNLYYVVVILLTLIFSSTAYLGVKHIVKLSYIGVPLLVILIISGISLAVSRWGSPNLGYLEITSLPTVFGLVLGTFVNGSIVLSFDYQRFCKTPRDAIIIAFTNFLGFWSFIIILSAIPAVLAGMNLYDTYTALGLLPLAVLTLFLLAWTSADNQLYSASLSWTLSMKVFGKMVYRERIVIVGTVLTIILAIIRLHTFALQWLSILTAISLPAGIVIWTEYYITSKLRPRKTLYKWNVIAFISWILGSIIIYYLYISKNLWYGIPIGFLTTLLSYLILSNLTK